VIKGTLSFNNSNGYAPIFPPTEGADGNLYGTTLWGGLHSNGVLYKIDARTGLETVLHDFGVEAGDGAGPQAGVILGSDSALYGSTNGGGANETGTLYRFRSDGTYERLYSFPRTGQDMQYPTGNLLQHTNGKFYGTAYGTTYGCIYVLDMGLPPFVTFVRAQGHVGATAEILGQALTGTTSVTFNGIPATSFSVVSDTYMTAVVPIGAMTGPVVVTTPTGTLTSNKSFRISQ
jgi:uncharacterized repeat protein (TIGR03803 family)